jgi:hypothetical protein
VSARCSSEYSVRTGDDVDVEVDIDLKCGQDHEVQLVHERSLVGGVGVFARRHLEVIRVSPDVLDCAGVEVLNVDNLSDFALALKLADCRSNSADCPRHFDSALIHERLKESIDRQ